MSFESVKQKGPRPASEDVGSLTNNLSSAAHRMTNLDQVHKLLEGGFLNVPQPQDTEK
jgi:CCR4-NOT transcription complex subunit 3